MTGVIVRVASTWQWSIPCPSRVYLLVCEEPLLSMRCAKSGALTSMKSTLVVAFPSGRIHVQPGLLQLGCVFRAKSECLIARPASSCPFSVHVVLPASPTHGCAASLPTCPLESKPASNILLVGFCAMPLSMDFQNAVLLGLGRWSPGACPETIVRSCCLPDIRIMSPLCSHSMIFCTCCPFMMFSCTMTPTPACKSIGSLPQGV